MSINIFEQASAKQLRFQTKSGQISTEDLWGLPLQSRTGKLNLDDIARSVSSNIKSAEEESFVTTASAATTADTLRLDILKHIISVKKDAAEKLKNERAVAEQKQTLLKALANKKVQSIEAMSEEDLEKELAKLG
jgi:hypothetical protein